MKQFKQTIIFSALLILCACSHKYALQSGKLQHAQAMVTVKDSAVHTNVQQADAVPSGGYAPKTATVIKKRRTAALYKPSLSLTFQKYPIPAKAFEKTKDGIKDPKDKPTVDPSTNRFVKVLLVIDTILSGLSLVSGVISALAPGGSLAMFLFPLITGAILFLMLIGIAILLMIGKKNKDIQEENERILSGGKTLVIFGNALLLLALVLSVILIVTIFTVNPITAITLALILVVFAIVAALMLFISIAVLFFKLLINTLQ